MAAAATVSIIVILIAGLVLVGFIVGIVMWATAGRRGSGEMSCGACGYAVRGLEALQCPECGADLRAVGIGRGGSSGRRTTGMVLTIVCGLLLLSCCGLTALSWMSVGASRSVSPPAPTIQTQPAQPVPVAPPDAAHDSDNAEDEDGDPAGDAATP